MPKKDEPEVTPNEFDLARRFYDVAYDYPAETFEQITKRVLGWKYFAKSPRGKSTESECREGFKQARDRHN